MWTAIVRTDFQKKGIQALAVKVNRLMDYPSGSLDVNEF